MQPQILVNVYILDKEHIMTSCAQVIIIYLNASYTKVQQLQAGLEQLFLTGAAMLISGMHKHTGQVYLRVCSSRKNVNMGAQRSLLFGPKQLLDFASVHLQLVKPLDQLNSPTDEYSGLRFHIILRPSHTWPTFTEYVTHNVFTV